MSDEVLDRLADMLVDRVAQRLPVGPAEPVAFTVVTLAAEVDLSPKVIRGAIQRGELQAVRRGARDDGTGGRFLISADAVRAWATPEHLAASRAPARRSRVAAELRRPLRTALADLDAVGSRGR